MESRYKIILSNNNLYKEIEFSPELQRVVVGTAVDCDYRLHKNMFFGQIELAFTRTGDTWSVVCSDNLYITLGDVRKLITKQLVHGDILEVRYQNTDIIAFTMEFLFDFDNGKVKYERVINITNSNQFSVGTDSSCHLVLRSPYVKNDYIQFSQQQGRLTVNSHRTTYGLYHNGQKVAGAVRINSGDFFSVSDYFFYYKNGYLWTQIRQDMGINGLQYGDQPAANHYPKFNRNTRIRAVVDDEKIEIMDPPAKPQKPKNNLLGQLIPSLIMIVAGIAMSFVSPFMLLSSLVGVVTAIIGVITGKRDFKENSAQRIAKYNAYIATKKQEIEAARKQEYDTLQEIYISPELQQSKLAEFSSDLFDRNKDDEDFLCVRLGVGDVEAKREIDFRKQERLEVEDELQLIPENLYNEYKNIHNAPICCDLKEMNAVGVVGDPAYRFDILKNMTIDLAARHYYTDVKLMFVAQEENKDQIRWIRMLPHVYNDALGIRNIVCDGESKNILFEYLYKELTDRVNSKEYDHRIVIFFYDSCGFQAHPISKFIDQAKELGVTFVFFGQTPADIPQGCDAMILVQSENYGQLVNSHDKRKAHGFAYPRLSIRQAEGIVNLLAPVYTEEISLEGALTKNISMFEMLNIIAVDDIDLETQWKQSQVFKSMAAPIGVSTAGIVELDLHDKAHGPHGLVAGTTGSGKSEILQTYILAMATLYHPYEVGFVIIDFKGGGMVNQFRELPHLVGAITNIDGKEINRSLKSIKAELQKRQRLFAEAEVNHIDKYIKKYKANEVSVPLPHLIIIVDEFAELKAEQPEFMKELISAARIGRSLGVHLILATQKPSGQVNEQIWSNSRFKLCLKVQSQEDSNEVLKSPLAAEIKEPGRAYLQVGNNEIFELFQSAYSGAAEKSDTAVDKEFAVYSLTDSGRRVPVYVQKKQKSGEGSATQLDAIVRYVRNYCDSIHLHKLPDICLPSLEKTIDFAVEACDESAPGYPVELGIYDDPDSQYQGVYSVDLSSNNLMLIGSSQSGKTNMLQSIIRSLSTKFPADQVSIYVMDFGSMVLKNFDKLNHVGGVVCSSEDEKLKNLFKLLQTEMELRKEKLMSVGVSSFAAYREAGMKDMPLMVLIIDNLTALKELYLQDDDDLLALCREGLAVGLSVIIANSQTSGIGYKYLSNFSARVAMFCNDSGEYSSLFDHCREKIENIPGRCIVEIDKKHYECQSYLAFPGGKEIDRVQRIREYVAQTNAVNRHAMAKKIPLIPSTLTKDFMMDQFSNYMEEEYRIVAGLDYATVTPYVMDFASLGVLAIAGREGAGRHNWIRYCVDMLETAYPGLTSVYAVDGITKKLSFFKGAANVAGYSMVAEEAVTFIRQIEEQLKQRYDALVAGDESVLQSGQLLMLIMDNPDSLNAICNSSEGLAAYKNIVGRYKNMKVCILTLVENANISYTAPEILKNIRDQKNFMFFDDMSSIKLFDPPLAVLRSFKKPIEPGDGYYIHENQYIKMKTVLCMPGGKQEES